MFHYGAPKNILESSACKMRIFGAFLSRLVVYYNYTIQPDWSNQLSITMLHL